MTLVIAAIIAAIILVLFNKQQVNKVSNKMYTDDVRQLYLLTTAEYKINTLERLQLLNKVNNQTGEARAFNIDNELAQLTSSFQSGEIQLNELNMRLDYLLKQLNIDSSEMAQIC